MSMMPTASLLTKALKGDSGVSDGDKAFQRYAELSGKGEASPLWIKIYYPFADKALKPLEVPIRRSKAADAGSPAVSDLIGLALFRYDEEKVTPVLKSGDKRVKKWDDVAAVVEPGDRQGEHHHAGAARHRLDGLPRRDLGEVPVVLVGQVVDVDALEGGDDVLAGDEPARISIATMQRAPYTRPLPSPPIRSSVPSAASGP